MINLHISLGRMLHRGGGGGLGSVPRREWVIGEGNRIEAG